ncbi:hypothetical protein FOL46_005398 [Perkinsus olseni]|uniref:Reverse transcriptase domain-containing protein n=1 Tax=Perkinsus olseni TaxID=32597 RepID=A0A7J6LSF4_PEROL|nr:hypothetical protein FOL46_005398 [Perkinsus olseni]
MVSNWVVEDNVDTASDHAPITFDLLVTENPATVVIKKIKNYRKSDLVTFDAAVGDGLLSLGTPKRIASAAELESVTRELSDLIAGAVETSSPLVRAVGPKRKRWWSGNLERLKVDFYSARRLFRKGRLTIEELHRKKNDYYHAIRDAKRDCFKADLARIGKDGRGLKKLLSKKEKSPDPLQVGSIDALADHFLGSTRPCCGPTWYSNQDCTNRDDSLKNFLDGINDKAVVNAIKGFDDFKSAGPDNVMYYHWKRAILHHGLAEHIAEICKGCLRTSTFPSILKVSHTILIPKKGRAGMRGFRPITLSNTLSKIVEKVLLNSFSRVSHPGCEWQHAYSSGRNTSTFVNEVIDAYGRGNASRSCSLIVSADIKGAFDACSWRLIHKEACRVFPQPIVNFVDDYLSGRVANLVTSGPSASRELTAGFPQGSVLGPYLWKLATAGILEELNDVYGYFCKAYAYADDFVVVVRGMDSKDLVDKALVSLDILESWAKSYGMDIEPTKVEFLVRNGLLDAIDYERLNRAGSASDCIRMVGILLDANLSFGRHISHQCAKAKVMVLRVKTFARLSYGLGDDAVIAAWEQFGLSIATYGSEVWGHKALNSGTYAILS